MMEQRRRMLKTYNTDALFPKEYQQVEYLQSAGTQWIDTGAIGTQNTRVRCEYLYTGASSGDTGYGFLFGSRVSSNRSGLSFIQYPDTANQQVFVTFGANSLSWGGVTPTINQWHEVVIDKTACKIDDTVYFSGYTQSNFTTPTGIILFAINNSGAFSNRYAKAKIRRFIMHENGVLVSDLFPCYRKSDSVAGMYDKVRDVFYTNSGGGTFLVGYNI